MTSHIFSFMSFNKIIGELRSMLNSDASEEEALFTLLAVKMLNHLDQEEIDVLLSYIRANAKTANFARLEDFANRLMDMREGYEAIDKIFNNNIEECAKCFKIVHAEDGIKLHIDPKYLKGTVEDMVERGVISHIRYQSGAPGSTIKTSEFMNVVFSHVSDYFNDVVSDLVYEHGHVRFEIEPDMDDVCFYELAEAARDAFDDFASGVDDFFSYSEIDVIMAEEERIVEGCLNDIDRGVLDLNVAFISGGLFEVKRQIVNESTRYTIENASHRIIAEDKLSPALMSKLVTDADDKNFIPLPLILMCKSILSLEGIYTTEISGV